jgi:translocation and assembly module TamB
LTRATLDRFARLATLVVASAVLLVVLIAAGLWWWSGTEGSLDWVLHRIGPSQQMQASGVHGSLRSGLQVERLTWEVGGFRIEAEDVTLEWQPTALVTRTVQLERFRAARVRVTDQRPPSADPLKPPESIALPVRVKAEHVAIAKLEFRGRTSAEAQDVMGAYAFDGLGHELRVDNIRVAGGQYQGEARLGATGMLPLQSTVNGTLTTPLPESHATVPLAMKASAKGALSDFRAQVVLRVTQPVTTGELPQATATARITPFAAQPVPEADADLRNLDLAALWPNAPRSLLSGRVHVQPAGLALWGWQADLRNAVAAPWDTQGLPLASMKGHGQWRGGDLLVEDLDASAGGGRLHASGQWQGGSGWKLDATLQDVDPSALHTQMASAPLSGTAQLARDARGIAFDVALKANGRAKGKPGNDVAASLGAIELRSAKAQGRWSQGELALPQLDVRAADASVAGSLRVRPADFAGSGRLHLQVPGLEAKADGDIAAKSGRGTLQLDARNLALAQHWLARVPLAERALPAWDASGQAAMQLAWQGGWRDPAVQASLTTTALEVRPRDAKPEAAWSVREGRATLAGRLADAQLDVHATAERAQRRISFDVAGHAGRRASEWHADLPQAAFRLQDPMLGAGVWRVEALAPLQARWSFASPRFDLGAGRASLIAPAASSPGSTAQRATQALVSWQPAHFGGGLLQTSGRIGGLPMAWLELLGPQLAGVGLTGNMVFDAQWNVDIGRTVSVDAALARVSGDVNVFVDGVDGASAREAAGVRDARLVLAGRGDNLTLTLRWDSERAGTADARLVTSLAPGGAAGRHWADDAPLGGFIRAKLPRIGVWSLLAPPGWRLRGSLAADVALSGRRNDPQFSGTLAADDLALRSVVEGVELRNGRLRARLEGQRLQVDEFLLHGAEGGGDGWIAAKGAASWTAQGPRLNATAQLNKLHANLRSDRDVTVSGDLAARVDANGTDVRGRLAVDRARIVLPDELPPRLDEDVVVRHAEGNIATAEERKELEPDRVPPKRPFHVAVDIDLGNDFRLQGRGLDTKLRGTLALTGDSLAQPHLVGLIRTNQGEYRAYGQRLDIERGLLRFTGALDNPSLDILAIRPHLTQRVGVTITGAVQSPVIRLYSEPDMPDADKLTWLVTGRAAPATGAESALLQQAAVALLASRRGGSPGGVAGRVGLDELSVRRDTTEGAVVTLGKRFAHNFYAAYERSLSGALGTLYIFYDLSKRLTVRAEAGERTGVDLIFTFSFDRGKP